MQVYGAAAKQLYRDVSYLKKVINVEIKHTDSELVITPGYNGALYTFNGLAQGDTDGTRDGDSLKVQDFAFKCLINNNRVGTARVIVLWDQGNEITGVSDVLNNSGTAYAPLSLKDWDKRFESKIIFDKMIHLGPYNQTKFFKKKLRIGKHTQFEAGTTTINSGALKMIFIGDSNVNMTSFRFISRLTYTDN